MNADDDQQVHNELTAARDDLRATLIDAPIPAFETRLNRPQPALLVAAALVLLVGAGLVGRALTAGGDGDVPADLSVVDGNSASDEQPDGNGRTAGADAAQSETSAVAVGPITPDPVFGFDDTEPSPAWTKPGLLDVTTDPAYGTPVRRLTSAAGTRFDRVDDSRLPVENADGSLLLTYHGTAVRHVYDRVDGTLVRALEIHNEAEPIWHADDPFLLRHIAGPDAATGDLRLYELDVRTGTSTVVADLTDRITADLPAAAYLSTMQEGTPSRSGRHWAWVVFDGANAAIGIVTYDLEADSITGLTSDLWTNGGTLEMVSMSPTGAHVLAVYERVTVVHDRDLGPGRVVYAGADSGDLALSADGSDSFVHIDFTSGPNGGWLLAVDLATLNRTRIVDLFDEANTSITVSGAGYEKLGWVVVATHDCKVDRAWSCDKVMAVEMVADGRVVNLAHTYSCADEFWTEPEAVVNTSFTRVHVNSDGGSCGIDAEVYELTLPDFD